MTKEEGIVIEVIKYCHDYSPFLKTPVTLEQCALVTTNLIKEIRASYGARINQDYVEYELMKNDGTESLPGGIEVLMLALQSGDGNEPVHDYWAKLHTDDDALEISLYTPARKKPKKRYKKPVSKYIPHMLQIHVEAKMNLSPQQARRLEQFERKIPETFK